MKLWMFDVERRVAGTRTDYEHAKQAVIAPDEDAAHEQVLEDVRVAGFDVRNPVLRAASDLSHVGA